ncbi:hypothetical protein GLOTRDRAFT_133239 [Gloeophyllum trabeum ATCC 11539]|uniref:Uncharacterized protein n=1 Tax=Gloeophyllum trabeum (strain ATCC 11539 / FP-39264 / Madison 617) TaxID=670483 RepID=S7RFT2_GLOTA|nr:uncharacterized protein GLOTRDRAFT_133239 [Gloeophyllum trabeum ATCC 11539]EPQ51374.1 hypothetical protein GLOTRDRAFT_133239 [Gloeophyllum trabeum ATCC 11539]
MSSQLCTQCPNTRSIWEIVYGCVLTVFACTWLAIHPNIPDQREGKVLRFIRRAGLMIMALIAPELVVVWAARQWIVARRLAENFRGLQWTQTHGFFALMGGFALCGENFEVIRTLNPDEDLDHLDSRIFPRISEEQIQDKSKADFLAKGVVVMQTGWFLVQCAARIQQGLPITEIEITTAAFAVLNFFTYALWWNKPLGVDCPHLIREDTYGRPLSEGGSDAWPARSADVRPPVDIYSGASSFRHIRLGSVSAQAKEYVTKNKVGDVLDDIVDVIMIPLRPFFAMVTEAGGEDDNWHAVPVFHAGSLTYREGRNLAYFSMLIAMTFGAIHCAGWTLEFPTDLEKWMWRIASLTITGAPIYGMVVITIYRWSGAPDWLDSVHKFTCIFGCVITEAPRAPIGLLD